MTIRRTNDPNVCFMETDAVTLWCNGIIEWRIDRQDGKFLMTPIMRDKSEGPVIDATEAWERFLQERERG